MALLLLRARTRAGEGRRGRGRARARAPGGSAPARGRAVSGHARGGGGLSRERSCSLGAGRVREDGGPGEWRPGNPSLQRIAGVATAARPTRAPRRGHEAEHRGMLKEGTSEQGWRRTGQLRQGISSAQKLCPPGGLFPRSPVSRASFAIPWGSFSSSSKHPEGG